MNMVSLVLVAIVAFTYFGGQNVPKVLKDNKQMILGVFVGVLLHQFMGIGVEGSGCEQCLVGDPDAQGDCPFNSPCLNSKH